MSRAPADWIPFEQAVGLRRFDEAGDRLTGLLDDLKSNGGILKGADAAGGTSAVCTRLTASVTDLMLSPEWRPSELQHRRIARSRHVLTHIAGAGTFRNLDHVVLDEAGHLDLDGRPGEVEEVGVQSEDSR